MITNEQQLNYALSEPSAALIARMKEIDGDIMILGAGGKVGPSLAVMAKKAAAAAKTNQRVYAVSRFTDPYVIEFLREEGVERPSAYLAARGCGTHQSDADPDRQYDWCSATVSQILARPEYMGHTVNFRSQKLSYKDRQTVRRPKEEWAVLENTHERIVSAEIWQLAQHVRQPLRPDSRGVHSYTATQAPNSPDQRLTL